MSGIKVDRATTAFQSARSAISRRNINWGDWLAPALILVMPFVNFLDYHAYGLSPLELHVSGLTRTDLSDSFSVLFAELAYGRPIEDERAVIFLTPTAGGPSAPLVEYPFPDFE